MKFVFVNKAGPIMAHTLARAQERIGADCTTQDLANIAHAIRDGGGRTFASHISKRVSIHHVEYRGRMWKVVYNNGRGLVKTVTPLREKKQNMQDGE
jgi:hypothetical protein